MRLLDLPAEEQIIGALGHAFPEWTEDERATTLVLSVGQAKKLAGDYLALEGVIRRIFNRTKHGATLSAYKNLPSRGFEHDATAVSKGSDPAHVVLPAVHRVASLLKRWLMGTHHGGWGAQHVEAYLDEFIFRFNRRQSNARGLLFYRLLQNAVAVKKLDYETLVWSRRGQAGKVRGRKRKPGAIRRRRANSQRGATGS